jgi:hypothetical protein
VEIAGPFKIEGKPYTINIKGKTSASTGRNTIDAKTSEPAKSEIVAAKPLAETEPAKETVVTAGDGSVSETEPTEVTPTTDVEEAEVPVDVKEGNWTIVSVAIGVSAAAAGVVILKITKII